VLVRDLRASILESIEENHFSAVLLDEGRFLVADPAEVTRKMKARGYGMIPVETAEEWQVYNPTPR